MGRPPIGKVAMTGAERTRLYRLKHAKPVTKAVTKSTGTDAAELAQAKARLAEKDARIAELEAVVASKPAKPDPATKPGPDPRDEEIAKLKASLAAKDARMAEIERESGQGGSTRIAELEAELTSARNERDDAVNRYWRMRTHLEVRTEGVFTRKEFNKVRSLLHPDKTKLICGLLYPDDKAKSAAEEKRYAEAFDIFSRCEALLKKEPLPPPPELPTTLDEWNEARLRVKRMNRERGQKAAATRARKKPGRQLRDGR
jgi:hypothetical protein